jgi:hypothetical protein
MDDRADPSGHGGPLATDRYEHGLLAKADDLRRRPARSRVSRLNDDPRALDWEDGPRLVSSVKVAQLKRDYGIVPRGGARRNPSAEDVRCAEVSCSFGLVGRLKRRPHLFGRCGGSLKRRDQLFCRRERSVQVEGDVKLLSTSEPTPSAMFFMHIVLHRPFNKLSRPRTAPPRHCAGRPASAHGRHA